jgi:hypothetical protein
MVPPVAAMNTLGFASSAGHAAVDIAQTEISSAHR